MKAVFEEATSTTHNNVTDAILMWTDVGEGDLETMLGRDSPMQWSVGVMAQIDSNHAFTDSQRGLHQL